MDFPKLENTFDEMKKVGLLKETDEDSPGGRRLVKFMEDLLNLSNEFIKAEGKSGLAVTLKGFETATELLVMIHGHDALRDMLDQLQDKLKKTNTEQAAPAAE